MRRNDPNPSGSLRAPPEQHRTTVRFDRNTWASIEAAAAKAGLTPTTFIAKAADAAALQAELREWTRDDELDDWDTANREAARDWGDNE